jgi:hypothetical protein
VDTKPIEHSANEIRELIESHLGGIPVIICRDGNHGWSASLNASPEIKTRYQQRLQEVLAVLYEHQITLRETH